VVKFLHRYPGDPSVFVRRWRSAGAIRVALGMRLPEQHVKHRVEPGELLMLREIERI